jgi:hypothetical protein
MVAGLVADQVK